MTKLLTRVMAAIFAAILASGATAETRVALVVGNSSYTHTTKLPNPANDAAAIATKLRDLGFDVMERTDLTGQSFRMALGEFTEKALHADLALFFYAGHGIEMSGRNYLIPIDAEMRSEATAQFETVSLDQVMSAVQQANELGMVLLDACRDNPFGASMRRNNGTRSVSRGLAPIKVEGEKGVVISFAAEAGTTADDGDGQHSPYTSALLTVIDEPGLEVGRMFRKVRAQVRDATDGRQVPIERMQLPDRDIYLASAEAPVIIKPKEPEVVISEPKVIAEDPLTAYFNALGQGTPEALSDFLRRYPNHEKAADARNLLVSYQDDAFWEQVKKQDNLAAYRRYLLAFAEGSHVDEAAKRIAALQPSDQGQTGGEMPQENPGLLRGRPQSQVSPTFDCARAGTPVEHAICNTEALAWQDHDLVAAFKSASSAGRVTRRQQSAWVGLREAVCGNGAGWSTVDCIETISSDRIGALNSGRFSGRISPSFNCAKAGTTVERTLCSEEALARQDQILLNVYRSALNAGWTSKTDQRNWIKSRESRCGGQGSGVARCVAQETAARIQDLSR